MVVYFVRFIVRKTNLQRKLGMNISRYCIFEADRCNADRITPTMPNQTKSQDVAIEVTTFQTKPVEKAIPIAKSVTYFMLDFLH